MVFKSRIHTCLVSKNVSDREKEAIAKRILSSDPPKQYFGEHPPKKIGIPNLQTMPSSPSRESRSGAVPSINYGKSQPVDHTHQNRNTWWHSLSFYNTVFENPPHFAMCKIPRDSALQNKTKLIFISTRPVTTKTVYYDHRSRNYGVPSILVIQGNTACSQHGSDQLLCT